MNSAGLRPGAQHRSPQGEATPMHRARPAALRHAGAIACAACLTLAACNQTMPLNTPAGVANAVQALASPRAGGTRSTARPGVAAPTELAQMLVQSFDQIDEKQEIEIGRQLAAILLGSKPLLQDPALQRYVNQLGRWISLQSSRPQLPWTFGVLDDAGFNAFAAPGGYVFVTRGLVERMRDEAELGGVLSHEIVHVVNKHHLKAMAASARTGLLANVAASSLRNNAAGAVGAQMLTLGRQVFSRGLDKDDEYEADRQGVALAARAGLDPFGLLSSLQHLSGVSASDAAFTLLLKTHPAPGDRVDRLESAMGNRLDGFAGQRQITIAQRLGRASLWGGQAKPPVKPAPAVN